MKDGRLYIVATPIGNLDDISSRGLKTLADVDVVAAEDTRHSRKLLNRYGISTSMVSYRQHNQSRVAGSLLVRLKNGESVALITDAGTPAISDPGVSVVKMAHDEGIQVIPIPGPSALTCALSVCGLAVESVRFEGFLPARKQDRLKRLKSLSSECSTMVFFEAPHRVVWSLRDMADTLGVARRACVARELTKIFETIRVDNLDALANWVSESADNRKGEFVVIVEGIVNAVAPALEVTDRTLRVLLEEFSPRKAAELAARITGGRRNFLYRRALELSDGD